MRRRQAPFVWYDLLSTDVAAAQTFYGRVLGWSAQDSGTADHPYTTFSIGAGNIAGRWSGGDDTDPGTRRRLDRGVCRSARGVVRAGGPATLSTDSHTFGRPVARGGEGLAGVLSPGVVGYIDLN